MDINFLTTIGKLKRIKRSGWIYPGKIKDPETVSGHIFRLSVLAMIAADEIKTIDKAKIVRMALVHDLAESIFGDIVGERGVSVTRKKIEKEQKEPAAVRELFKNFSNAEVYVNLWIEYESQQTNEARILKQLDKLEMTLQALEYEKETDPHNLDEFFENSRKHIVHPMIKKWFNEVESKRKGVISK